MEETTLITGRTNDQQRIPDWYAARLGRFSCSKFSRLMTEPRSKADKEAGLLSDGAMTYILECVAEKITGKQAVDDFTSKQTDWGIQFQPIATAIYEQVFEVSVIDQGYIEYENNSGGSPDGLIGDDGIVEFKCPFTITNHLKHRLYDLKSEFPEYYWQVLGYLLITGRKWIDFVSYHPDYPAHLQMKQVRIYTSAVEDDINTLKAKLKKAFVVLNEILNGLKEK